MSIIERINHLRQLRQPGPVDLGPEDNGTDQDQLFAELSELERLAEAAPDLLAACEAVIGAWESGDPIPLPLTRAARDARTAIAKAKGD